MQILCFYELCQRPGGWEWAGHSVAQCRPKEALGSLCGLSDLRRVINPVHSFFPVVKVAVGAQGPDSEQQNKPLCGAQHSQREQLQSRGAPTQPRCIPQREGAGNRSRRFCVAAENDTFCCFVVSAPHICCS